MEVYLFGTLPTCNAFFWLRPEFLRAPKAGSKGSHYPRRAKDGLAGKNATHMGMGGGRAQSSGVRDAASLGVRGVRLAALGPPLRPAVEANEEGGGRPAHPIPSRPKKMTGDQKDVLRVGGELSSPFPKGHRHCRESQKKYKKFSFFTTYSFAFFLFSSIFASRCPDVFFNMKRVQCLQQ